MTEPAAREVIRASELGEYAYCARAWWLRRVQGEESHNQAALQAGQAAHTRHGRTVQTATTQRRSAWVLAALALLLILLALAAAALHGGAL